jgi:hypothetical protein
MLLLRIKDNLYVHFNEDNKLHTSCVLADIKDLGDVNEVIRGVISGIYGWKRNPLKPSQEI